MSDNTGAEMLTEYLEPFCDKLGLLCQHDAPRGDCKNRGSVAWRAAQHSVYIHTGHPGNFPSATLIWEEGNLYISTEGTTIVLDMRSPEIDMMGIVKEVIKHYFFECVEHLENGGTRMGSFSTKNLLKWQPYTVERWNPDAEQFKFRLERE